MRHVIDAVTTESTRYSALQRGLADPVSLKFVDKSQRSDSRCENAKLA